MKEENVQELLKWLDDNISYITDEDSKEDRFSRLAYKFTKSKVIELIESEQFLTFKNDQQ